MVVHIKQTINKVDDGVYTVTMQVGDSNEYTEKYEKSNSIFPVYRELSHALFTLEDCEVIVSTNSETLVHEFNSIPNRHKTHLSYLKETAVRQGITLTINHDQN